MVGVDFGFAPNPIRGIRAIRGCAILIRGIRVDPWSLLGFGLCLNGSVPVRENPRLNTETQPLLRLRYHATYVSMATASQTTTLWDIARLFLKLGTTAFGGPAAHIAMLQQEVVERRHWISQEEFLDHLGASNLIPGPTSTELVIHIGRRRGGWPGLLVAGTCLSLIHI